MTKLSPDMNAIIEWLFHYPGVRICWSRQKEMRPQFNYYWASEAARQQMIETTRDLVLFAPGDARRTAKETAPRRSPQGETPRVTRRTFHALLRRKLIRAVEKRVPRKGWSDMFYYQLTIEGKSTVTGMRIAA